MLGIEWTLMLEQGGKSKNAEQCPIKLPVIEIFKKNIYMYNSSVLLNYDNCYC